MKVEAQQSRLGIRTPVLCFLFLAVLLAAAATAVSFSLCSSENVLFLFICENVTVLLSDDNSKDTLCQLWLAGYGSHANGLV